MLSMFQPDKESLGCFFKDFSQLMSNNKEVISKACLMCFTLWASMILPPSVLLLLLDSGDIFGWTLPGINMSQSTDQTTQPRQTTVYTLNFY